MKLARAVVQPSLDLVTALVAVVAALAVGAVFIAFAGAQVGDAYGAIWDGAFGSRPQTSNTLQKAVPLTLVALGWIVAARAKRLNIGLEGQVLVGAMCATFAGQHLDLPLRAGLLLSTLAGAAGGALWCGVAAWMWARRGVNEIISTLMLNLIAVQVVGWALRGPLAGGSSDVVRSEPVAVGAQWPTIIERTPLTWAVALIPLAALVTWVVLQRTTFGYRLRFVGASPSTSRVAGIDPVRTSVQAMLLSGALAGVAGSVLVLGSQAHALTDNISGGVGYSGIVAALLAGGSPFGAGLAGLGLAALAQGGGLMEARTGVPAHVTGVLQGTIIALVASTAVLRARLVDRLTRRMTTPAEPRPEPVVDVTDEDDEGLVGVEGGRT